MTAEPHVAFGTILAVGDGGTPETFIKIAMVKDIDGPSMSRDTIDVTNHDSPKGYKQFLASLRDGGEVTFKIEYDPGDASHDQDTGLLSYFDKDVPTNCKLVFPVEAVTGYWGFNFAAMVTGFKPSGPVAGSVTADITLKVAGEVEQDDIDVSQICEA